MSAALPIDWKAFAILAANGMTLQEISERSGAKLGTVKSRSSRERWKKRQPSTVPEIDWTALAVRAASGVSLEQLARESGAGLSSLKARSAAEGWKTTAKEVQLQRIEQATEAGQMVPGAADGLAVVHETLADYGKDTRLNLAKAASNAAKHASTLPGDQALSSARNLKEVVSASATLHSWSQPGDGKSTIINIALIGRELEDMPEVDVTVDVEGAGLAG